MPRAGMATEERTPWSAGCDESQNRRKEEGSASEGQISKVVRCKKSSEREYETTDRNSKGPSVRGARIRKKGENRGPLNDERGGGATRPVMVKKVIPRQENATGRISDAAWERKKKKWVAAKKTPALTQSKEETDDLARLFLQ